MRIHPIYPRKPDKYVIKIFWTCSSETNYPVRGFSLHGKGTVRVTASSRKQRRTWIEKCIKLTEDLKGITGDNFLTSFDLAEALVTKITSQLLAQSDGIKHFCQSISRQRMTCPNQSLPVYSGNSQAWCLTNVRNRNILSSSAPSIQLQTFLQPIERLHYLKTKWVLMQWTK